MLKRVRRSIRASIAAGLGFVLLAACGVGATPVDNPKLSKGKVTLTMNWWGADARIQQTMKAIKLFEAEHPNIEVKPQFSDWSGYWDRLATTTAAGDMPDVTQFEQAYLASYADRGALLDLSTVKKYLKTSAYPDDLLESGRVNGKLYGLPTGGTTNAVLVNTTLFKKYGIDLPDTDRWTWKDFERASVALSKASDGKVHGVLPFGSDAFSLTVWARQHGKELYNDDGELILDVKTLASYWQRELDLINSSAAPSVAELTESLNLPLDQSSIATGKVGTAFISAGQFTAFQQTAPKYKYALATWPTDPDTTSHFQYLKPAMHWSAASTTRHPAEAALLINFLANDTRVAKIFGLERGEPGNPAFLKAVQSVVTKDDRKVLDFSAKTSDQVGKTPPITPNGASDIALLMSRYNQQVLFKDATPEQAASAFIRELGDSIRAAR
ncbi:ABC transporter substrate-binding protein [Streptomyces sp. bgisy091]|uniref:ABC transporter substrate-binding protein n=1 Tax=Streptomyces sp. bgisy091 TaxID=3413778 RepID=UPI003D74534C